MKRAGLRSPSWAAISSLQKESFELMAGIAFNIAVKSYMAILTAVIDEFKLNKHDPKIKARMDYARMVPWTDGDEQAAQLRK